MQVRFGVTLEIGSPTQEYAVFGELCRFLDESGVTAVWIGDEQTMRREIYVGMTVVALNSQRLVLNVGPTNPLTRHLAVTASGMSTLDELSGGRAALTMSVGFTNVANVGLRPVRLAELKEYILAIKALWRDHEVEYQGRTVRLLWPERSIPIYMTAEGPRTMRLAGQIADGVLVGLGHTPEVIEATLGYIRQGAEEAGRRLEDLDIWWQTRWNIAEDYTTAVDGLRSGLATAAAHALSHSFDGKLVPQKFQEPIRRIQEAWVHTRMGSQSAPHTAILDDEPDLTEYLAQRFAIAGTVSQFIERVEQLAELGATQFRLGVGGSDRNRLRRTLGNEIIPHFQ